MNMSNKVIRYFILTFLLVAGFALTIFGLTKSYISLGFLCLHLWEHMNSQYPYYWKDEFLLLSPLYQLHSVRCMKRQE